MMIRRIKTIISLTGWAMTSCFFTLICVPFTLLPAHYRYENRLYFFITTLWGKALMFFSFITIKQEGALPNPATTPAIIVMNHSSSLDIFLLESIAHYPHIWLTKAAYNKIPLFSILLKRLHVPVERYETAGAAYAFFRAYKLAKKYKSHLFLFPEGKRYNDGKVHPFHQGFALLAKKLHRPVIPIAASGFYKIFPKGKRIIDYHATKPQVWIGPPLTINEDETLESFSSRVTSWLEEKLAK